MHRVLPAPPADSIGLILPRPPRSSDSTEAVDSSSTCGSTSVRSSGTTSGITTWLTTLCRDAEACGASALWAVDHLFWGQPLLECLTTLAVAATTTRTATLGTCVLQLPLRNPAAVAKQATNLQLLSDGRFVLGVGVGSHQGEYELAGSDFACRGAALDAGIAALRSAWATVGSADGRYRQEPASAPVPIWIGGSSERARRRAAQVGDGWIPLFVGPDDLASGLERIRTDAATAGRPGEAVAGAVVVPVAPGNAADAADRGCAWLADLYGIPAKAFRRHLVSGPVDACVDAIAAYHRAGARHVALMVADDRPLDGFAQIAAALGMPAQHRIPTDVPPQRAELAGVGA